VSCSVRLPIAPRSNPAPSKSRPVQIPPRPNPAPSKSPIAPRLKTGPVRLSLLRSVAHFVAKLLRCVSWVRYVGQAAKKNHVPPGLSGWLEKLRPNLTGWLGKLRPNLTGWLGKLRPNLTGWPSQGRGAAKRLAATARTRITVTCPRPLRLPRQIATAPNCGRTQDK
jgi:hypothetical protein